MKPNAIAGALAEPMAAAAERSSQRDDEITELRDAAGLERRESAS